MEEQVSHIWELYENCKHTHDVMGLNDKAKKCHNFYHGKQWEGLQSGDEEMPFYNFIKGIVNYKTSMISRNRMQIVFNTFREDEETQVICRKLDEKAEYYWERLKMDKLNREVVKTGCIVGGGYVYFSFGEEMEGQRINTTNLFFANENSGDIQGQEWILIRERRNVEEVKAEARASGMSEKDVADIVGDSDDQNTDSHAKEAEKDKVCTSLLYLTKKDGYVVFCRTVKNMVYQTEQCVVAQDESGKVFGMELYPLVHFSWEKEEESSRGIGEVITLIPNQIECNKSLVRRALAVKMCSFGKPVYNSQYIENPETLTEAGTAIEVSGSASDVRQMVSYLEPINMSGDAHKLNEELLSITKELAGAGDGATGQIDPTKASGTAIMAARDQSAIPLNDQSEAYQQYIEDIALVWIDLWVAYEGIQVGESWLNGEDLRKRKLSIKIDVSPVDSFSRYKKEESLEIAMGAGHITFAEYVEALPEKSTAPKAEFVQILRKREEQAKMQQPSTPNEPMMPPMSVEGGMPIDLQQMPM